MGVEPELKFHIAPNRLQGLTDVRIAGARPGQRRDQSLVSTYFDTPKQKLRRRGLTVRVREVDGEYTQTVKKSTPGSFERGEWETRIRKEKPDIHALRDTPLRDMASRKLGHKIEPVFRTIVRRVTRPIHLGATEIELAVDRGSLAAQGSRLPIAEFELELKKGHPAALFRVARLFERRSGAELDLRSKAEQGYRLVSGTSHRAVRAEPVCFAGDMTASEAFNIIAYSTLRHFSANADLVRAFDGEAIHQMRVGLRRLRTAISLFGDVLPAARTAKIKTELKWLTGELAPAREIDVFLNERVKPVVRAVEPKRGGRAIEQQFLAERKVAFQRACRALETSRYRNLLIDLVEWLQSLRSSRSEAGAVDLKSFVKMLFKRRIPKACKQGRRLERMSARERHKLRIRIKKLHYAVDFFKSCYSKRAQRQLKRLSARLKKIQQVLGALNDFIAHRDMASHAALEGARKDRRARAFVAGLVVGQERAGSKTLLKTAIKEFSRLRPPAVKPA